ncbi:MAG: Mur ligase domain-containing protein, partial [Deferribacteraceae bacterium]|nr:Mur ligase domain-containing protein [Deferribacteraceae bacterium]
MNTKKLLGYFEDLIEANIQDAEICGATLDSREVRPGNIFFAHRGEHVNGNEFAQAALDSGASLVVMDDPTIYETVSGSKILVANTLTAMEEVGRSRLASLNAIKIAVTGSFGKTSTKEMIRGVLSE